MEKNENIRLLERYFEGKATKQEVEQLLNRMNDPDFEQKWMQEQWDTTDFSMNPAVQKQIFDNIQDTITPVHRFHISKWLAVAAAVVMVFTTSLSVYLWSHGSKDNRLLSDMMFQVEKGQKASMVLPDGSKVWLNSGSKVMYGSRYNKKERIIHLDGEAYFEVAPDKNAPFMVQSHGFSVKALGTAFDVKAYSGDKQFSAVLVHGKVEIADEKDKIYLHPNQKMEYDPASKTMTKKDVEDGNIYAEWRNNQLTFESTTFEDIAAVLERNYNVKLVFQSESLKKYRYSGIIGNTSLESMLQLFAMTSPLSYKMQDSVIYLFENKSMMHIYKNVLK